MEIEQINTKTVEIVVNFFDYCTKIETNLKINEIEQTIPYLLKPKLVKILSKVTALNIIDNDNGTTTFRFGCFGLNLILDKNNIEDFRKTLYLVTGLDTYSVKVYDIKDNEVLYAIDYTIETPDDLNKVNQWVYDDLNKNMEIIMTNC